jgi:hypothetical protein
MIEREPAFEVVLACLEQIGPSFWADEPILVAWRPDIRKYAVHEGSRRVVAARWLRARYPDDERFETLVALILIDVALV